MGHAFGLQHSGNATGGVEYQDAWDAMSFANYFPATAGDPYYYVALHMNTYNKDAASWVAPA